jgi:dinuclear metal center YbgI/SA1388 family protein
MTIQVLINYLESKFPSSLQESYDNSGLLVGDKTWETNNALITVDVTEEVLDEAIDKKANLIIAHHPLIFSGIKRVNGDHWLQKCLIKAIKHDIAIYAIHTNMDNVLDGTNSYLAKALQLTNIKILKPAKTKLFKLAVFCPDNHVEKVRKALFDAGAGQIGNYDHCSFNVEGTGTFRGDENTNPYIGQKGKEHHEQETRVETIFPAYLKSKVISQMLQAHPYEEVAYDLYPLANTFMQTGSGIVGDLAEETNTLDFLHKLKKQTKAACLKHTQLVKNKVKRIALCGGSGAFLIQDAIGQKADVYITGDIKYHDFFEADEKLILCDIGHFESEQFTKEILYDLLKEKFPTFAVLKSERNTNPVNYL